MLDCKLEIACCDRSLVLSVGNLQLLLLIRLNRDPRNCSTVCIFDFEHALTAGVITIAVRSRSSINWDCSQGRLCLVISQLVRDVCPCDLGEGSSPAWVQELNIEADFWREGLLLIGDGVLESERLDSCLRQVVAVDSDLVLVVDVRGDGSRCRVELPNHELIQCVVARRILSEVRAQSKHQISAANQISSLLRNCRHIDLGYCARHGDYSADPREVRQD